MNTDLGQSRNGLAISTVLLLSAVTMIWGEARAEYDPFDPNAPSPTAPIAAPPSAKAKTPPSPKVTTPQVPQIKAVPKPVVQSTPIDAAPPPKVEPKVATPEVTAPKIATPMIEAPEIAEPDLPSSLVPKVETKVAAPKVKKAVVAKASEPKAPPLKKAPSTPEPGFFTRLTNSFTNFFAEDEQPIDAVEAEAVKPVEPVAVASPPAEPAPVVVTQSEPKTELVETPTTAALEKDTSTWKPDVKAVEPAPEAKPEPLPSPKEALDEESKVAESAPKEPSNETFLQNIQRSLADIFSRNKSIAEKAKAPEPVVLEVPKTAPKLADSTPPSLDIGPVEVAPTPLEPTKPVEAAELAAPQAKKIETPAAEVVETLVKAPSLPKPEPEEEAQAQDDSPFNPSTPAPVEPSAVAEKKAIETTVEVEQKPVAKPVKQPVADTPAPISAPISTPEPVEAPEAAPKPAATVEETVAELKPNQENAAAPAEEPGFFSRLSQSVSDLWADNPETLHSGSSPIETAKAVAEAPTSPAPAPTPAPANVAPTPEPMVKLQTRETSPFHPNAPTSVEPVEAVTAPDLNPTIELEKKAALPPVPKAVKAPTEEIDRVVEVARTPETPPKEEPGFFSRLTSGVTNLFSSEPEEPAAEAMATKSEPEQVAKLTPPTKIPERQASPEFLSAKLGLGKNILLGDTIMKIIGEQKPVCVSKENQTKHYCMMKVNWPDNLQRHFKISSVMYRGTKSLVQFDGDTATRLYALFPTADFNYLVAHYISLYGEPTLRTNRKLRTLISGTHSSHIMHWKRLEDDGKTVTILELRQVDDVRSNLPDLEHGVLRVYYDNTTPIFSKVSTLDFFDMD